MDNRGVRGGDGRVGYEGEGNTGGVGGRYVVMKTLRGIAWGPTIVINLIIALLFS